MTTADFAQLDALFGELRTLHLAAELFNRDGDGKADDAAAAAICARLVQLANLTADLLGNERPYA